MAGSNGYSPIQSKMLSVLVDGKPHTVEQLHACCGPSLPIQVKFHIRRLRKRLPNEYDIAYLRREEVTYYVLLRYPAEPHPLLAPRVYP